jgi:hypothetical protein
MTNLGHESLFQDKSSFGAMHQDTELQVEVKQDDRIRNMLPAHGNMF